MIKKITQKVVKEVAETIDSVGICDICGKEFNYEPGFWGKKVAEYYHIVTGHLDWGNDSCDSIEHKDACSEECLSRFTQEWLKDEDVIKSNTAYININKARHVRKDEDKKE